MKRTLNTFAAAALVFALAGGVASASESEGAIAPDMAAKITEVLKAQGYDVRKIQSEDGRFEAYALKDGKKFEIYLDAALTIVETKISD